MKTHHILICYTCFGVGMFIGQGVANSIWWIVVAILAAVASLGVTVLINRQPRKKRLPVRRSQLKVVKSRKVASSRSAS
jgi:hypothetical protein